jgi:hypothetical protein
MSTTTDSPLVSTLPIGLVEFDLGRSYGLRLYLPVPDPEYLLTHPDLAIYRDTTDAIQKLSRSHKCPPGMSRVFAECNFLHTCKGRFSIFNQFQTLAKEAIDKDINSYHGVSFNRNSWNKSHVGRWSPNHAQLRLHEWQPSLGNCIAVLDTPIITDADTFKAETLTMFPDLTCLTTEIHEALTQRDEFDDGGKGIFGLPSVKGVRLTKSGKIRRKPGTTIRAAAAYELEKRGSTILNTLYEFALEFTCLMNPTWETSNNNHIFPYRHLVFPHRAPAIRGRQAPNNTLEQQVENIATRLKLFNQELESLLNEDCSTLPWARGKVRTRLIYLRSFHAAEVNKLLSTLHHILPILKNYPTTGFGKRINASADCNRAHIAHALHRNLYRLALAMQPGRSGRFMFPTPAATAAERLSTNDGQ